MRQIEGYIKNVKSFFLKNAIIWLGWGVGWGDSVEVWGFKKKQIKMKKSHFQNTEALKMWVQIY